MVPFIPYRSFDFLGFSPLKIEGLKLWSESSTAGGRNYITANNNAAITTSVTDPFGKSNGVCSLASPDYLSLEGPVLTRTINRNMTIEGWFKFATLASPILFLQNADNNTLGDICLSYSASNASIDFWKWTGSSNGTLRARYSWSPSPVPTPWHHIQATWKSDGDVFISVDGTGSTITPSSSTEASFSTGYLIGGDGNSLTGVDGNVSNFRLSDNVARYTSDFDVPGIGFNNDEYTVLLSPMTGKNSSTSFVDYSLPDDTDTSSAFIDLSKEYNHLIQATGSNRPTYELNEINGEPAIAFASGSSQDFYDNGNYDFAALFASKVFTISWVVKSTSTGSNYSFFGSLNNPAAGIWCFSNDGISNGPRFDTYNADSLTGQLAYSTNVHDGSPHVITVIINGSNGYMYVDGTLRDTSSSIGTIGDSGMLFRLGSDGQGPAAFYNGQMPEIVIYDSALSDINRVNIETYLINKFNI